MKFFERVPLYYITDLPTQAHIIHVSIYKSDLERNDCHCIMSANTGMLNW